MSKLAAIPSWRLLHGWKGLGRFWLFVLLLCGTLASWLQMTGPKHQPAAPIAQAGPAEAPAPPDPHPVPLPLPRVAILVAGIGMSVADSTAAIETLPPAVSLAMSPYAADPARLIPAVQDKGHEILLSLPMEPENFPLNDANTDRALMTSLPEEENLKRLRITLGRFSGYTGVTNVLGAMRGERFLNEPDMFNAVLREVTSRGLFFVDTGNHPPQARDQAADIVLDDAPLDAAALDERLDRLVRLAQEKGSAVGVAGLPRPVVRDRIAAWARDLVGKGVALVPVGALIPAPAASPAPPKEHAD